MRDRAAAATLLIAANLLWAGSYVASQLAVSIGAGRLAALRFVVAGLISLPFWLRRPYPPLRAILMAALLGVIGNAFGFGLQLLGLQHSDATIAALSIALEPLATALWARAILGERLGRLAPFAFLTAFVGVWLLAGAPRPGHGGDAFGVALLVAATVCYGLYSTLAKPLLRTTSASVVTGAGALGAGIALMPSLALGPNVPFVSLHVAGIVLYLAIIVTLLANWLFFHALSRAEVSFSAFFLYIQPLAGAVLGWVLLGETLGPTEIIGAVLLLGAVALGSAATVQAPSAPASSA